MRKDIIKPNETEYNGYLFRSKLEAQWAVVFDSLGIRYEYEPEGFELEDGTRYLPDFYFPDQDTYGEVKPDRPGALEELFDKSLKFVENGTIERLIILPNIPAATKKYPVWWVPIVVKNPFEPFSDKDWPFSNLLVTKAMLNKKRISMNDYPTIHQINIDPEFFAIDIKSFIDDSRHHRKPNKWVVKSLHDMFLQAIPSREMNYFLGCQILNPDMTMEDILAEKEVENAPVIMRAYKKARQARQCRRGAARGRNSKKRTVEHQEKNHVQSIRQRKTGKGHRQPHALAGGRLRRMRKYEGRFKERRFEGRRPSRERPEGRHA